MKSHLTTHQQQVTDNVLDSIHIAMNARQLKDKFVELNGAAGVGKTYTTIYIIQQLKRMGLTVAFTAPTHAAISVIDKIGKNMGNDMFLGTIHSFLSLKVEYDLDTGGKKLADGTKPPEKCDVLIIDEKSMICEKILDLVKKSIKNKNIKSVFVVGDGYQLPCVNDGVLRPFEKYFELREIVRQAKGNPIIDFATHIRDAIATKKYPKLEDLLKLIKKDIVIFEDEEEFLQYYLDAPVDTDEKIIGAYENVVVDNYNETVMNRLYPKREYVEVGYSFILQETNNVLIGGEWIHTQNNGERVMIITSKKITSENIYENVSEERLKQRLEFNRYVNNLTRKISRYLEINIDDFVYYECLDNEARDILIADEKSAAMIKYIADSLKSRALNADSQEERRGTFSMFFNIKNLFANVKYSHANTFHKLQGGTFKYVGIDIRKLQKNQKNTYANLDDIFRLLYVGVTRASDKLFILKDKKVVYPSKMIF